MKKILTLALINITAIIFAQNIKVNYVRNSVGYADMIENIYLNNNYKISITDSIAAKIYDLPTSSSDLFIKSKYKTYRTIIINNTKDKDLYFTHAFKNQNYLVNDNLPDIKWKIHNKDTKKIGKYLCTKATTTFRGTDFEAYYTQEIPVSLAPFKLSGLPGLVLEMRALGENHNTWTVKTIEYPYKGTIDYSPKYIKSLRNVDLKKMVAMIDSKNEEDDRIQNSKLELPAGVKIIESSVKRVNGRSMIENKFEWEK